MTPQETSLIQTMKRLPPSRRTCLHHSEGETRFKLCTNDYHCDRCEFDQVFDEQYSVQAVVTPVEVMEVQGCRFPQGYYLHQGHSWVKIEEGSTVRIGIDDFALRLLGPLDRVEMPLLGKAVEQGKPHITVTRGVHRAAVLSPVSGVVTAVNTKLREKGKHANEDPYAEGWVMTLHCKDLRKEIRGLMIAEQSARFLEQEVDRVHHLIEEVSAPLAADGGTLGKDVFGAMPELGWEKLAKSFLRTDPCS